jgi:excisionase family DNA binding protein
VFFLRRQAQMFAKDSKEQGKLWAGPLAQDAQAWAEELGLSARTIRELMSRGLIDVVSVGRRKLILRKDMERFLEGNKTPAHDAAEEARKILRRG